MAVWFRQRLAALTAPKASSRFASGLPGRFDFDPVVAGLHAAANVLLGWTQAPQAGIAWIGDGVDHLDRLLEALTDLLHLHQPQVRCKTTASSWAERLLQDLVLLADAHGRFCDVLLYLKQLLAEAQAAVRHRDAASLKAALRVRRRSDRALAGLASTLHGLSHRSSSPRSVLAEAVAAATCAAAAASAAIFVWLASAWASSALRELTSATPAKAMERLRSLEERVLAAEDGCEQVHRGLVNTRASLLNLLTPCC